MMDFVLEAWVSGNIERAKASWVLGKGDRWQPGQKLKLLFAGYNGTRNTGSDVRPEETLRQLRHILGADNVEYIWKLDDNVQGQAKTYAQHMLDLKQIRQLPKFETFLNPKFSNEIANS